MTTTNKAGKVGYKVYPGAGRVYGEMVNIEPKELIKLAKSARNHVPEDGRYVVAELGNKEPGFSDDWTGDQVITLEVVDGTLKAANDCSAVNEFGSQYVLNGSRFCIESIPITEEQRKALNAFKN